MNDQLPWEWLNGGEPLVPDMIPEALKRPWLNAAATSEQIIDDTVIAVKINAMEAHWDDVVPCNAPGYCPNEARWMYRCPQGHEYARCDTDRAYFDKDMWDTVSKGDIPVCGRCNRQGVDQDLPSPIPWLPL